MLNFYRFEVVNYAFNCNKVDDILVKIKPQKGCMQ